MKKVFIETANVQHFRKAVSMAVDTEKGRPGMVAVWGEAGSGRPFTFSRSLRPDSHNGKGQFSARPQPRAVSGIGGTSDGYGRSVRRHGQGHA